MRFLSFLILLGSSGFGEQSNINITDISNTISTNIFHICLYENPKEAAAGWIILFRKKDKWMLALLKCHLANQIRGLELTVV